MSGAGTALQRAALAKVQELALLTGAYGGPPLQAVVPFAVVEAETETDWGAKGIAGREVRLTVTLRDEGESALGVRMLSEAVQTVLAQPPEVEGWRVVTFVFLRSRTVRDGRGAAAGWASLVEYRARLLALPEGG